MRNEIEIVPLSPAIGAEVRGIDVARELDGGTLETLRGAWLEHLVLLFRDQRCDDRALVRFTGVFGELEIAPLFNGRRFVEDVPEIMIIANAKENGRDIGSLGNAEAFWHSDLNFTEEPPAGSFLYAIEVPPAGGDTGFANMYAAWETMPGELKAQVAGRKLWHDARFNSAGYLRETRLPDALHPIVRTHPETGRQALYLGRRANGRIDGLAEPDSEALLDALWTHATQPSLTWHHRWRRGDLIMWDNRCTLHRRDPFDATQRRVMHRTQSRGTRPF